MKRGTFVTIIVAVVLLATVLIVVGFYRVENLRGARAWEQTRRELSAHGEPLDLAALVPLPVPDDRNLAMAPVFARSLEYQVDPATSEVRFKNPPPYGQPWNSMPIGASSGNRPKVGRDSWQSGRPMPLDRWQQFYAQAKDFPHPPQPGTPAADILLALTKYAPLLDETVRETETRPQVRFPVDWQQEPAVAIRLPHFSLLARLVETLRLRASAELVEGRRDEALRDTIAALRLGIVLGRDPLLVGFLSDCTNSMIALQPVWEGLAQRRWSADALRQIQEILRQENHLENYVRGVRGERWALCATLDAIYRSSGPWRKDFETSDARMVRLISLMPRGWIDQNKAVISRLCQRYIDAVDVPARHLSLARAKAADAEVEALREKPYLVYTIMARTFFAGSSTLLERAARTQTACDQARVACALERYALEYQNYPDTLAALVPAYLDGVPSDVMDGAPMRYRRTEDGRYLLYGIGWNARDDGGTVAWKGGASKDDPARPDDKEGNWVWQYAPLNPPAGMW